MQTHAWLIHGYIQEFWKKVNKNRVFIITLGTLGCVPEDHPRGRSEAHTVPPLPSASVEALRRSTWRRKRHTVHQRGYKLCALIWTTCWINCYQQQPDVLGQRCPIWNLIKEHIQNWLERFERTIELLQAHSRGASHFKHTCVRL